MQERRVWFAAFTLSALIHAAVLSAVSWHIDAGLTRGPVPGGSRLVLISGWPGLAPERAVAYVWIAVDEPSAAPQPPGAAQERALVEVSAPSPGRPAAVPRPGAPSAPQAARVEQAAARPPAPVPPAALPNTASAAEAAPLAGPGPQGLPLAEADERQTEHANPPAAASPPRPAAARAPAAPLGPAQPGRRPAASQEAAPEPSSAAGLPASSPPPAGPAVETAVNRAPASQDLSLTTPSREDPPASELRAESPSAPQALPPFAPLSPAAEEGLPPEPPPLSEPAAAAEPSVSPAPQAAATAFAPRSESLPFGLPDGAEPSPTPGPSSLEETSQASRPDAPRDLPGGQAALLFGGVQDRSSPESPGAPALASEAPQTAGERGAASPAEPSITSDRAEARALKAQAPAASGGLARPDGTSERPAGGGLADSVPASGAPGREVTEGSSASPEIDGAPALPGPGAGRESEEPAAVEAGSPPGEGGPVALPIRLEGASGVTRALALPPAAQGLGGLGSGRISEPEPPPPDSPRPPQLVSGPELLLTVVPEYPRRARQLGVEGTVWLDVEVGPDGVPQAVHVTRSSGRADMDEAAKEAVLKWRFVPAAPGEDAALRKAAVMIEFRLTD